MAKKTGPAEVPPSRETWFPDEAPREPEDKWDPFGPKWDATKPPFIVNGVNPVDDTKLSAQEQLDWLTKQHEAMHKA